MSIQRYAETKRKELEACVAPFLNIEPLTKIEEDLRSTEQKYQTELKQSKHKLRR